MFSFDIERRGRRWLSIILGVVAILTWSAIGARMNRESYLTRGIYQIGEPIPENNSPEIGINVALEQYDDLLLKENLGRIEKLGVRYLKQSFYYEPDYDWERADHIFRTIAAYPTLQLVPLLDGNPAEAFAPPDPADYAVWVGSFSERYGDQIEHYIIWDEPNLTTHWGEGEINPDEYGALLAAAHHAIKRHDPTAAVVLSPLAPTTENNLINQSEVTYLQALYDNGAHRYFDIVSIKPYGFNTGPEDRRADADILNFSRAILLRELMLENGDGEKPIWAGNWGWHALPDAWSGRPSLWGETTAQVQAEYTQAAYERAVAEWPWMGSMFLQHWEPAVAPDDPQLGFQVKGSELEAELIKIDTDFNLLGSGFSLAEADNRALIFDGDWRFSPEFGADMSEKEDGDPPDQLRVRFIGTDVGIRVRRANYRARLNILIDGEPANLLPLDDLTVGPEKRGSALVLNTNDPDLDLIETVAVAQRLGPGPHEMVITGHRGWHQWAIKGVAVSTLPDTNFRRDITLLSGLAILVTAIAVWLISTANWWPLLVEFEHRYVHLSGPIQGLLLSISGLVLTLTGYLIWNTTETGLFRRLGDGGQMLIIGGVGLLFYLSPWVLLYGAALLIVFWLTLQRPALGLGLAAFSFPFYVAQTLKPIYIYRFSPVEIFTVIVFLAVWIVWLRRLAMQQREDGKINWRDHCPWKMIDTGVLLFGGVAIVSLFFTERIDVATNELRTVILGPILFYFAYRMARLKSRDGEIVLNGFLLGGIAVALIGLSQYILGINLITAEGGLLRLRAHYGSPNNVSLYLGRLLPILVSFFLMDVGHLFRNGRPIQNRSARSATWTDLLLVTRTTPWLRFAYLCLLLAAFLLTYSKGGILIGLPLSLAVVGVLWLKHHQLRVWPWLAAGIFSVSIGYAILAQIPALSGRLTILSQTGDFRLNLWRSSLNMIRDRPIYGFGLDNFLYAYRGKYILSIAWQEPNLNHPHNIIFDFWTRLGLVGLLSGASLFVAYGKQINASLKRNWHEPLATQHLAISIGLAGGLTYILGHGLVDHSFFLVDLAFSFMFFLAFSLQVVPNGRDV